MDPLRRTHFTWPTLFRPVSGVDLYESYNVAVMDLGEAPAGRRTGEHPLMLYTGAALLWVYFPIDHVAALVLMSQIPTSLVPCH